MASKADRQFVKQVQDIANGLVTVMADGRGSWDDRVAISQVYDVWSKRRRVTLEEFKSRLARVWWADLINLARNDYPIMDIALRRRSEIVAGSQYLHFIIKT